MAHHSCRMALRVARVSALFLALVVPIRSRVPTLEPALLFEAAFQGRCGEGSPCEQLCRELHDGTFECGCGPGFILHVDGYGCMQLNATKVNITSSLNEDIIYQKDVSFTAELEIAPQNKIKQQDKQSHIITTLPTNISNEINIKTSNNERKQDFIATGERSKLFEGIANLIDDGLSRDEVGLIEDKKSDGDDVVVTTFGTSLQVKLPNATLPPPWTPAVEKCNCNCGDDSTCSCPHTLARCPKATNTISVPRFSGPSWLALRTLHGAYKRVRIRLRVRPERAKGILLLTGENDDLSGDYLALVLRQGHVELRFECGSGAGILRTWEPVRLGRWNTITVYRHRWDAWLRLNQGKRVSGRSKGLFSRMTFREPVWLGGAGNTTGLESKLGLTDGLLGCVDYLRINGQTYNLMQDSIATYDIGECAPTLAPWKSEKELTTLRTNEAITKTDNTPHHIYNINDIVNFEDNDIVMRDAKVTKTNTDQNNSKEQFKRDNIENLVFENNAEQEILSNFKRKEKNELLVNSISEKGYRIDEIKSDEKCECQHGGGCVSGVCLCPLGYAGARCEITLDLKVPRFNGSSYLWLPGLGNSAESWLNIQITLKPSASDGLVLLDTERSNGDGDMFALLLRGYYVEFVFDLGSGSTVVRSASPLEKDRWHRVTVNRAGRKATLTVSDIEMQSTSISETRSAQSHGGARRLSLHGALYLGGAAAYPSRLRLKKSLSGCVKQLIINDEEISVVSAALGGVNVDNCDETLSYLCTDKNVCSEKIYLPPQLEQNFTIIEPHRSIVPKKGVITKHKRTKLKNNRHIKTRKAKNTSKTDPTILIETEKPQIKIPGLDKPVIEYESYKPMDSVYDAFLPAEEGLAVDTKYLDSNDISWSDSTSYPSFSGKDSYVHIDDEETIKRLRSSHIEINIRFRSTHHSGLLVWSGGRDGDYLALALRNSTLVFSYNLGSGEVVIVANHTRVDDGLWHRARATRNGQAGVLEVDGQGSVGKISPGTLTQLNTGNGLYIGGLPSIEITTGARFHSGLIGCVSQISLGGDLEIPLFLSSLQHMISSNVARCST